MDETWQPENGPTMHPQAADPPPSDPPPSDPPPGEPPTSDPPTSDHALRRPAAGRVIGGVAAGVAQYFEIDVALVRIAFVALALLGGSGLVVYLVAWVLIPDESGDSPEASSPGEEHRGRRRSTVLRAVIAVVVALAVLDVVSSGPWWPRLGWGPAPGLWLFALALILVALLVAPGSGGSAALRLRRLLVILVVAVATLATVALASVLSAEALSGVPLRGGIGNSQWQPTTVTQLRHPYRLAVGRLMLDLRDVNFPPGTTRVTASVGIGQVVVEVPPGPSVSVTARTGIGDVWVFGSDGGGIGVTRAVATTASPGGTATGPATTGSRVVLDAQAGLGQVRIVRAS